MEKQESIKFSNALAFATKKHEAQQRKDGTPYILHPIKVAMIIANKGFDVRYQIVGLFHDLLEDTDATEDELRVYCDKEMLTAVKLVTKTEGQPESEYINNILANPIAKEVKNADRIDNLTDLQASTNLKFKKRYLKETEEFFLGRFSDELDALYKRIVSGE